MVGQMEESMKSDYEERQQARQARYEELAEKNQAESVAAYEQSSRLLEHIPLGQPVLVGHHSERGHRRVLERAHRAMDRSVEASNKAQYYQQKALSVGQGGISSDDPNAIDKLQAKLEGLEAMQAKMREANKLVRKGDREGLQKLGFSETQIEKLFTPDFCQRIGFPDYALNNNNAEIRRLKKRIAGLERDSRREDKTEEVAGGLEIEQSATENRIFLRFPGKPETAVLEVLKRHGFRWAKSLRAWSRHLNNAGVYAAEQVKAAWLRGLEASSPK
jgi:hypothetical protein